MKTELTNKIERALRNYGPVNLSGIKLNKFRRHHLGLEVVVESGTVTQGIVDAIRIDEYFSNIKTEQKCALNLYPRYAQDNDFVNRCKIKKVADFPLICNEECFNKSLSQKGSADILITAFEIKISKSDFLSKNGHNFCGNLNYYILPKELLKEVSNLVPGNIGIIEYDLYRNRLKQVKRAEFKEKSDTEKMWLVLNVMKRKVW